MTKLPDPGRYDDRGRIPLIGSLADLLVGPLGAPVSAAATGVALAISGYGIGSVVVGVIAGAIAGLIAIVILLVVTLFATKGQGMADEDLPPLVNWAIDLVPAAVAVGVTLVVAA